MARVFISYKYGNEPEVSLSEAILRSLSAGGHEVFIDRSIPVGDRWGQEIESELRACDYLVLLLSEKSSRSELVRGEVEIARDQQMRHGNPRILPVRVAFEGRLPYPLNGWLDPIQWLTWRDESDTPRVLDALCAAVEGRRDAPEAPGRTNAPIDGPGYNAELPLPSQIPPPGGTLEVEDPWYVQRSTDHQALTTIRQDGGRTISIRGARQMGKSSLLVRIVDAALQAGRHAVVLDFQLFGRPDHGKDPESFFLDVGMAIAGQLNLEPPAESHFRDKLPPAQRCTSFLEDQVLRKLDQPLTLAVDETDVVFGTPFQDTFFGMLRAWHNSRALPTRKHWKKLDLVLATSTEPLLFIQNRNQSPFNVGLPLAMADFTREEVARLNEAHGKPLSETGVARLYDLIGGHPFLTRQAYYVISSGQLSPTALFAAAATEDGPFGDHLQNHLRQLTQDDSLMAAYRQIVLGHSTEDRRLGERLRCGGLAVERQGRFAPRCRLYEQYFRESLNG